ncbi:class I SAM-dependent methyltransferase [Dyadobacter subterraneus]|uniref:Class I SAM-dependent methyltransferase n=1 Tax=Dyadobacter subterraneus TaxID=2773304 RepID=A0ABR9WHM9_9BACT|nr:class I SAM-dependent methyltransferase [Dyadobacter subterraneus]MBE9465027.1 class I SAM-dependent methyltransferase [Dyadobacter subterraneus]
MTESLYLDGDYLKNNPNWHVEDSHWKAEKIKQILIKNKISPSTICEIGCGAGEILNQLYSTLSNTSSFIGYDISENAIDLAKCRTKERLTFKKQDLLLDNSAQFDLLLVIDVFEHIEDYIGFLRKCRQKAEYKVFHIPLDMTVQKVLRKEVLMYARQKVGHLHYFTRETALDTLVDAGYEILDEFYTPWGFEMEQKTLLKKIFQLPFRLFYSLNADLAVRVMGGSSLMVLAR